MNTRDRFRMERRALIRREPSLFYRLDRRTGIGPGAGSESPMTIPMTGLVLPANLSTNRGRRWLFLGLLAPSW